MIWRMAYRNLFRNRRRSLSTGVAICVGFVALNLLGAYIYRSKKSLDVTSVYLARRGHFTISKKGAVDYFQNRPKTYLIQKNEISELKSALNDFGSQIEYTSAQLSGSALLSNGFKSHPIIAYGFEPGPYLKSLYQREILKWAGDWVLPTQRASWENYESHKDLISITPQIADIMSFKIPLSQNESVQIAGRTIDGDLNAINADLGAEHTTGLQFLEDTVVLVPLPKMQELMATDGIESLSLYLAEQTPLKPFEKALRQRLAGLSFETEVFRFDDEKTNPIYKGSMDFLYVMGAFFVFLICTAVSLTIANSLTMGIIERTREIGTLRALGFKPGLIRQIFTCEGLLISLLSMIAGTLLSFLISGFINSLNIKFNPPGAVRKIQFVLIWNLEIALTVAAVLTLVAWVSSYIAIKRKSQVKLISLLHDLGES